MIAQFKEALAAKPSCIVIMGHPGSDAFKDLVKQAEDQGVVVTARQRAAVRTAED